MFKTWVTEKLGIKYPIIQGALLWLARAELAAAVSNAGGLGIIASSSFFSAEELRQEIRKAKSLTDKPFAVNIGLLPSRRQVNTEEIIRVTIEEEVKIIETSGRNPEPYIKLLKKSKGILIHKAARIRDIKKAEQLGYDAVTIVGFEGGGHPGMEDVTSLVLIPRAVDSVKIPVIAAGGFADGRGLVAALALGAQGVQMGTRFMLSQECFLHTKIKELMVQTPENSTMLLLRSFNDAARVIKTDFALKVAEMEKKGATLEELYPLIRGTRSRDAYLIGETNDSLLICGEVVGAIKDVPSVQAIIERTVREAELVGQRLGRMLKN